MLSAKLGCTVRLRITARIDAVTRTQAVSLDDLIRAEAATGSELGLHLQVCPTAVPV